MALPELTLPPGTPPFNADGHSIELVPMYADLPMDTGHDRRRRAYTTVPRFVNVKLELTYAQMLAVHEWFEGPLKVGDEPFSAQVANQGPGLLWWKARFAEPYTADADEAGQLFIVTAKLLLEGEGSVSSPYVPEMAASFTVDLVGSSAMVVAMYIQADILVELVGRNGALQGAGSTEVRWIWAGFNYAPGRSLDVTETQEFIQRSWLGV